MTIRRYFLVTAVATTTIWLSPAVDAVSSMTPTTTVQSNLRRASTNQGSNLSTREDSLASSDSLSQGPLHRRQAIQSVENLLDDKHNFNNDVVAGRGLTQCDACGNEGSCGRTEPLGDFFEVTIESSNPNSVWIVSCLYPNRDAPDCYYSPGGETDIRSITNEQDFVTAVLTCQDECCNWAYPRSMWADLPVSNNSTMCDGETSCRELSQVCRLEGTSQSKVFSCPVGTMMQIEGGDGDTSMKVGAGAQLVSTVENCQITLEGLSCSDLGQLSGFPLSAVVAADDCSCVTCDAFNRVLEGECDNTIPSYIPSEGICAPLPDPGSTCRGGEDDNRDTVRVTEYKEIVGYLDSTTAAIQTLDAAVRAGTVSESEHMIFLNQAIMDMENMQLALLKAKEYIPDPQSYILSLIAGIQTQFPVLRCGISAGCVNAADLQTIIATIKSLIEQIDMMLEL